MAVYNYADQFLSVLAQKYAAEAKSDALTQSNPGITFINAQTIKIPRLTVSGYRNHDRSGIGFNAGTVSNDWEPKKLSFDRDIELFIDPMDIDETNLTLAVANLHNTSEEEQAIPECDAYRFSKLYSEYTVTFGKTADTTALTTANVLEKFDADMAAMDEAGVPETGRILYVTPTVARLIKEAEGVERSLSVQAGQMGVIDRRVHSLDDVQIVTVPSSRMKTKYDFTVGFTPAEDAKQINAILVHPGAVVARQKYAYIQLFTPGHDSRTADKYVYQNRRYMDLFLLERKLDGVKINVSAT